jgi:hypothetical protein
MVQESAKHLSSVKSSLRNERVRLVAQLNTANKQVLAMSQSIIHDVHPAFDKGLLSARPEQVVAAFVSHGDLSIDEQGRVWRHRKKVGGNHPKLVDLPAPVRAENIVPPGRHQIQVSVLGKRIVCLASRLVWFLHNGEIPDKHHIHHRNGNKQDNALSNLACVAAHEHISEHGIGRVPPNKGTQYGLTDAYKKSTKARRNNHAERCRQTYEFWADGLCAQEISVVQEISTRQVYSRLQYHHANGNVL